MLKTPAWAAPHAAEPLQPFAIERREPQPHEVLIDIRYCGVCHSDLHQVRDDWGRGHFPMVPGHEIVGHVAQVGRAVERWKVGDTVGVGCFVDSCRHCEACREGEEQYCSEGMSLTYNGFERTDGKLDQSRPTWGGYSTRITVDENFVLRVPEGIALERAAPLLCAGAP
jgi:alcohol dehydrogenase (NADP+)